MTTIPTREFEKWLHPLELSPLQKEMIKARWNAGDRDGMTLWISPWNPTGGYLNCGPDKIMVKVTDAWNELVE